MQGKQGIFHSGAWPSHCVTIRKIHPSPLQYVFMYFLSMLERELSGEARDKNLKEWRQNDCGAEPPKEGGGNIFLEQLGIKHTKTEE